MEFHAVTPILGFDEVSEYCLTPIEEGLFYRLDAKGSETPSFTLIQPAAIRPDYSFDLDDATAQKLGLQRAEDALVLNIVILGTPLEDSYVNFAAPVVFNMAGNTLTQVILDSIAYNDYGVAEPIKRYLKAKE